MSEYNVAAKNIKDVAAGAVFVSAVGAVVVGLILFSDVNAYMRIFNFFCSYPIGWVIFVISTVISVLYVYRGPRETVNRIKNFMRINKKNQTGN